MAVSVTAVPLTRRSGTPDRVCPLPDGTVLVEYFWRGSLGRTALWRPVSWMRIHLGRWTSCFDFSDPRSP